MRDFTDKSPTLPVLLRREPGKDKKKYAKTPACKKWAKHTCNSLCFTKGNGVGQTLNGLTVIDIDKRVKFPFEVNTLTVRTRRGCHLYFNGDWLPEAHGVWEIKSGRASFVVCPPTKKYTVEEGSTLKLKAAGGELFTQVTSYLREHLVHTFNHYGGGSTVLEKGKSRMYAAAGPIPEGHRWEDQVSLIGLLMHQGLSDDYIEAFMNAYAINGRWEGVDPGNYDPARYIMPHIKKMRAKTREQQ